MLRTGRALSLAIVVLSTVSAHAADSSKTAKTARAANPAQAASDVTVFARYAGTWKAELHHVQTPYGKPSNETFMVKNDCWHSEIFYVCDQIIDGAPKALLVFFYNAEDKTFGSFPITARSDAVHPGQVEVDGKTITFPWQINDNGKGIYMRIINTFTTPDTIDFRQEYSEDGQKWIAMATGTEHRVSTKSK